MSARPTPPREPLYWPLTAPGMPNPGPDFVAHAAALGDDETTPGKKARDRFERVGRGLAGLYARALRQPGFALPVKLGPGRAEPLGFVVGHLWGQHQAAWALHQTHPDAPPPPPVDGPHPADVMLVGKMPGAEEEKHRRCLTGPSGELLLAELARARAPDPAGYYVTNLLKFRPPQKADRIAAGWLADCLPLLHMELRLVRPKVILCVGADAAKALLGPKATVREMDGVVREFTFPVGATPGDPATHTALVMAVVHPAEVLRDKSRERQFARGIARFALLASGVRWDLGVEAVDHRVVDSLAAAEAWAAEAEAELAALPPADRLVAWDAEWHGSHPVNRGSYLRTVQLSWADKKAVVFRLTGPGGVPAFAGSSGKPTRKAVGELVGLLNRFMAGKRAVGHFLVADLEWLHHYGFRPTDPCPVPLDPLPDGTPAWARLRAGEGWLDTGLLFHAVEETAQLGLDALSVRYTDAPRYDLPLERWKEQYCAEHKLDKGKLEGFGDCPDELLIPYACLHKDSKVQRADGGWEAISRLVRRRYAGKVKALVDGQVVDAQVTNWHRRDVGQSAWFKVQTGGTEVGQFGPVGPAFTPDHRVLTQRGKVEVCDLVPGVDGIATEEPAFSADQVSVLLGTLLGDGGFRFKGRSCVAFGFGQRVEVGAYADWKAEVFAEFGPRARRMSGVRRYELPASRQLLSLSRRFPVHTADEHGKRKLVITREVLAALGTLGLAVWYQDDGSHSPCGEVARGYRGSRIYCQATSAECDLVVAWLTEQFGDGVSYNQSGRFFYFGGDAYPRFHAAIAPFVHPALAYKTPTAVSAPPRVRHATGVFHDPVLAVVPYTPPPSHKGNGVRYCLTVEGAGNFLTRVGFVSNCYDADVTRRLAVLGRPLLDSDYDGNCCWEPFWAAMLTCRPILQMHVNGIAVDRDRLDRLTDVFLTARETQVEKLRDAARWPELNPRSILQVRELVFGVRHGKKDADTGAAVVQRPDGAISLDLPPALDTGKPQRAWAELERKGLDRDATPSTNKTAVGLLLADHGDDPAVREVLTLLRDYRYLDQALKTVLYDPLAGEDGGRVTDEDGFYEYEKGIAAALDDDGRVRTHLYPTTETRRWRSARPNLQNMCVLPNVDVLTRVGWVAIADLPAGEAVAQYDPAGGRVEFVVPSAHVRQDFAGELIRVEGFDFAQTVTPDHRLLVRPAGATAAAETTAAALLAAGGGGDVPLCGELTASAAPAPPADHPALVGFLAAHGQVVAVKGRAWVRLAVRDREAARLVQAALAERGLAHRWTHYRRGGSVDLAPADAVGLLGGSGEDWEAALAGWWGRVWDRHPDALRDLLDRVLAAARIVGPGEYRFKTRAAADRVQALAVVVRRPCVVRHTGTARDPWGVKFVAPAGWGRVRKVTPEAYAGPVHCLTVPSGYFLARQAGRVSVTGNSKARDDDYKKLLGAAYTDKIRSMFVASPGFVLVEADYKGAELFVAAVLAGDHQMIDHARRANFPDEGYDAAGRPDPKGKSPHPEYYDIHSNVAVLAFRLTVSEHKYQDDPKHPHFGRTAAEILGLPVGAPCPPNKFALKVIGKAKYRVLAKNVIFGLMYGRGARAIAMQARMEGVRDVTVEVAETIVATVFDLYPGLEPFFAACRARVTDPGWLANPFGGLRRFPTARAERSQLAEFERQAMNFPIQCLRRGTFVLTRQGYRRIETLVGRGGAAYPTTTGTGLGVAVASGRKPLLRVRTRRGLPVEASAGHVFFVYEDGRLAEKRADELAPGDWLVESHVRTPGGVEPCTPDEAYLAGLLIGDGSFQPTRRSRTKNPYSTIATASLPFAAELAELSRRLYGGGSYCTARKRSFVTHVVSLPKRFRDRMTAVGLRHTAGSDRKAVPDAWLSWSPRLRAAVLAGLLDAEVEFRVDRTGGSGLVFTNTSRDVAEKVYLLWSSLGFAPAFRGPYPNGRHKPFFRVSVTGTQLKRTDGVVPCRHPNRQRYGSVALRDNGLLPPDLVRRLGAELQTTGRWTNAEHGYIRGMRVRGYGTPARVRALLAAAGKEEPLLDLRFDRVAEVAAAGEEDDTFDVTIRDGLPRFTAAGLLVHNSSVADMVDRAVAHLDRSIAEHELGRDVRLLLSIHDAVLLECRPHLAGWVGGTLLPFCMKDAVPLVPADLDGRPTGAAPYHLDIDVEVMERWGVPLSAARAAELGVDPGVAH